MPHKRAKRSVRQKTRSQLGEDLVPEHDLLSDEAIPKSAARVLNAASIREQWKLKKRALEGTQDEKGSGKRRRVDKEEKLGDKSKVEKALSHLTIKPGESIQHFNRRVEEDMRPLVKAAVQSSSAVIRNARKEVIAKTKQSQMKSADTASQSEKGGSDEKQQFSPPSSKAKDFQKHPSSAPRRLNDIAKAPPDLKNLPRGAKKVPNPALRSETVLSMAQKAMMEKERESVIARYRALKASRYRSNGEKSGGIG